MIAHERGEKLRVFKFKPKRGYKRRTGHRQELTRIEVTELALGGGSRAKAAKETVAKPHLRPRSPPRRKPRRRKRALPNPPRPNRRAPKDAGANRQPPRKLPRNRKKP